ncbi:hypothetical protein PENSPDRAFT_27311 [Peniophora sp. CONT]|nr:hypothetical protein PENSPDRAFT_27311 [Peniophora sp. CONT]
MSIEIISWLQEHRATVLCVWILLLAARFGGRIRRYIRKPTAEGSLSSDNEKAAQEAPFEFPRFKPWPKPLSETPLVPYRPFRWGDYHVTMGIRTVSFDDWIELDQQHAHYHRLRTYRAEQRGSKLIGTLPASDVVPVSGFDAARELVLELSEYLSRRYPQNYSVERHPVGASGESGWYGEGRIHKITMLPPISVTYDLDKEDPITVAGLLVQDDLALMLEGKDGVYYLRSGSILTAGFWRVEDKLGMSLDDIHLSGNVPQYQTKLKASMNRFFARLTTDKLIQRNNYFFKLVNDPSQPVEPRDPNELGWAEYMVGEEDAFAPGRGLSDNTGEEATRPDPSPSQMRLRMERQTLRRLPRTGAVCFTIRTYVVPLEELAHEPGVPGRAASAIRSWPQDVAGYKNRDQYEQFILPYLDECHRKQLEEGLLKPDEKPGTDYPY